MSEWTGKVELIELADDVESAARVLAHVSAPGRPKADLLKLLNLWRIHNGLTALNRRSRSQVIAGAEDAWRRLRHAIEIGEASDRLFARSQRSKGAPETAVGTVRDFLAERDPEQFWDPWKPVQHLAAGLHIALLETRRGTYLWGDPPVEERVGQLLDLLQHRDWLPEAVEAATARFGFYRLHGWQPPRRARFFVLSRATSRRHSQKSPPERRENS